MGIDLSSVVVLELFDSMSNFAISKIKAYLTGWAIYAFPIRKNMANIGKALETLYRNRDDSIYVRHSSVGCCYLI